MNAGVVRYEEKRRRKGKKFKLILPALFFILLSGTVINPAMCKNSFADTINLGNANVISGLLNSEEAQLKKSNQLFTNKHIFKSSLSEVVINKKELQILPPVAGGIQALSMVPGIIVRGYNANVGAARNEIMIRGFASGWSSASPDYQSHKLMELFDGVPSTNLDGHWVSSFFPFASMLQGINVIYGPGNPSSRWYASTGGTINFIPIQPTDKPGADVNFSVGSYNAYTEEADMRTGLIDGWSTVIAAGNTNSNNFRQYSSEYPTKADALYIKTVKTLENGYLSFGYYDVNTVEKRPNFIPVSPLPGVYTNGLNGSGTFYSEQTS